MLSLAQPYFTFMRSTCVLFTVTSALLFNSLVAYGMTLSSKVAARNNPHARMAKDLSTWSEVDIDSIREIDEQDGFESYAEDGSSFSHYGGNAGYTVPLIDINPTHDIEVEAIVRHLRAVLQKEKETVLEETQFFSEDDSEGHEEGLEDDSTSVGREGDFK